MQYSVLSLKSTKSHNFRTQFRKIIFMWLSSPCNCYLDVSQHIIWSVVVWPSAISAKYQFFLVLSALTVRYMTAASCWWLCRMFKNCVSAAEFYVAEQDKKLTCTVKMGRYPWPLLQLKSVGIIFDECASVYFVIQHAFRISSMVYYISFCVLSGFAIFLFIIS